MTELQPCTQHCTPHRTTPHPQEQVWRGCVSSGTGLALHLAVTQGPSRTLATDTVGTHSSCPDPGSGEPAAALRTSPPPCSHPARYTGSHRTSSAGPQGTSLTAPRHEPSTRPGPHRPRAQGPELPPTLIPLQGQQSVLPWVTPALPLSHLCPLPASPCCAPDLTLLCPYFVPAHHCHTSPLALPLPCPCSALHTGWDCSALPHGKRGKSDRLEAKLGLWLL